VHNNRINPINYKYKILCVYNNLRSTRNRFYSKCTCIYSKILWYTALSHQFLHNRHNTLLVCNCRISLLQNTCHNQMSKVLLLCTTSTLHHHKHIHKKLVKYKDRILLQFQLRTSIYNCIHLSWDKDYNHLCLDSNRSKLGNKKQTPLHLILLLLFPISFFLHNRKMPPQKQIRFSTRSKLCMHRTKRHSFHRRNMNMSNNKHSCNDLNKTPTCIWRIEHHSYNNRNTLNSHLLLLLHRKFFIHNNRYRESHCNQWNLNIQVFLVLTCNMRPYRHILPTTCQTKSPRSTWNSLGAMHPLDLFHHKPSWHQDCKIIRRVQLASRWVQDCLQNQ